MVRRLESAVLLAVLFFHTVAQETADLEAPAGRAGRPGAAAYLSPRQVSKHSREPRVEVL